MKALAVLTLRNEASFLLEWLAHHRAVGFTDFLVLSNDCDDGTDRMLDRLEALGLLTHLRNDGPYDKGGIQFTGLKLASKHKLARNADWILALDIDEFVNIHTGDHTLPALFAALPEASAITLTWRLFGNADQVHYQDTPVTRQFHPRRPCGDDMAMARCDVQDTLQKRWNLRQNRGAPSTPARQRQAPRQPLV